jgi:hypothetical protein
MHGKPSGIDAVLFGGALWYYSAACVERERERYSRKLMDDGVWAAGWDGRGRCRSHPKADPAGALLHRRVNARQCRQYALPLFWQHSNRHRVESTPHFERRPFGHRLGRAAESTKQAVVSGATSGSTAHRWPCGVPATAAASVQSVVRTRDGSG